MTLDGYGEFPKYPGSDVPSKEPGEGFTDMWIKRYDSVDTILYGRRSYEGHRRSLRIGEEAIRSGVPVRVLTIPWPKPEDRPVSLSEED